MTKRRRLFSPITYHLLPITFLLAGCGMGGSTDPNPSSDGLNALAWTSTTPANIETGSGLVTNPQIAMEPDGGSAMAVWLEQRDENTLDNIPPITHLYARRFVGGSWAMTDAACPADGRSENSDGDGICLMDAITDTFDASAPRISMDVNGDGIVVWQQNDGTDQSIYARTLSAGVWSATPTIIDAGANNAAGPDISVEPDGGGTAVAVFTQFSGTHWLVRANRCLDGGDAGTACGDSPGEWGEATGTGLIGATFGPNSPTSASGTNWTTPANVVTSDNIYAVYNNTAQNDLCVTGFGFTLPAGLAIGGITVTVEGNGTSATAAQREYRIGLTKTGCALAGTRQTGIEMTLTTDTDTIASRHVDQTNPADVWGTTWTAAEINASAFGVLISDDDGTAAALNIDRIRVTVNAGNASSPRVALSNTGVAQAVWVQTIGTSCLKLGVVDPNVEPADPGDNNFISIPCEDTRVYQNRFTASWSGATDITPTATIPGGCFEGELRDFPPAQITLNRTHCIAIVKLSLSMDAANGGAFLVFKTVEQALLVPDRDPEADGVNCDIANCVDVAHSTKIWGRRHDGTSWGALADLAEWYFWPVTGSTNCTSRNPRDLNDPSSVINCDLETPQVAADPDGTTAMVVSERRNGTGTASDIIANRFSGTAWERLTALPNTWAAVPSGLVDNVNVTNATTLAPIDDPAGGDAHTPQIAMDNAGNAVAVWVQKDGAGKWRIHSRCYAPAIGAGTCGSVATAGWQTVGTIDGNVGAEDQYFNPVLAMSGPGGANSAISLFIGFKFSSTIFGSFRLYGVTGP